MVLVAHFDARFFIEIGACSHADAHIFLSHDDSIPRPNGQVLSLSHIIKYVMASPSEAELAALYHTDNKMVLLRNTLDEMGWP